MCGEKEREEGREGRERGREGERGREREREGEGKREGGERGGRTERFTTSLLHTLTLHCALILDAHASHVNHARTHLEYSIQHHTR